MPDAADRARNELEVFYLNHKIYDPVFCGTAQVNGAYYVFCEPTAAMGSKIGGLYKIVLDENGQYKIYSVNGKALGHSEG